MSALTHFPSIGSYLQSRTGEIYRVIGKQSGDALLIEWVDREPEPFSLERLHVIHTSAITGPLPSLSLPIFTLAVRV